MFIGDPGLNRILRNAVIYEARSHRALLSFSVKPELVITNAHAELRFSRVGAEIGIEFLSKNSVPMMAF